MTRPIRELASTPKSAAQGDSGKGVVEHTGDELDDLAAQLNRMSAEIKHLHTQMEERAEARAQELAAMNAIAAMLSQSPDLGDVLSRALKQTLAVIGLESGGIYLVDEETGLLRIAAYEGFGPEFAAEIDDLRVGEGFSGRVVESGQTLVVPDVSSDPRLTRLVVREEAVHSLAIVPLSSKGTALGTLFAMTHGFREFSEQDLQLLTSIGQQIGIAVENAYLLRQARQRGQQMESLYRTEQRRADQFRVISEVGYHITSILPVGQLLDKIARSIQEAFGYYHVGIGLIEGDEVVYRIGAGALWDDPDFKFKPARLKVGSEGLSGWAAAAGQPVMAPDVAKDPRYVWLSGSSTRSELVVPITVKGQVFGLLDVQSDRLNAFDESDAAVLQALAHQAGAAIENARLYEQARQVAVMEERNRLARDLHDAVTQSLFSASLIAESVPDVWQTDPREARELLEELRRLSRGALAEMRTLLLELRPGALAETSLSDLLHQLAEATAGRSGLAVSVDAERGCSLPTDVHVALYRIAQEALNNVVKHAQAHSAAVTLRCSTAMGAQGLEQPVLAELRVQDDGRGFDPGGVLPHHLGLRIIRERAEAINASLTVESEAGKGSIITLVWASDARPTSGGQG